MTFVARSAVGCNAKVLALYHADHEACFVA